MFKQDYEALAQLIKVQRKTPGSLRIEDEAVEATLDNLARDMAQYMSRNQHFDEAKFLAAAGVK